VEGIDMKRTDFRFFDRLRVRWVEVDLQKIVFNGHYLMYFDTAIAAYWRAMAMPYPETMAQLDGDLFVRKATLEYMGSARYDDLLDVALRCERVGNSSMAFTGCTFRGETALVSCELVYVFADPKAQTSRPVPDPLRQALQAFEAGEPMVQVATGSWDDLGASAQPLRKAVFIDEQQIPAALEQDGADPTAVHALARNRFGLAVATGRMVEIHPGVGKIGRMAVAQAVRGSGIGRQVLDALLAQARQREWHDVVLHAQVSAVAFYRAAGFLPHGPVFEEAGIVHQEMRRAP
jgi:YbgC/YbaW family acyl-CoA thioester hydrolase